MHSRASSGVRSRPAGDCRPAGTTQSRRQARRLPFGPAASALAAALLGLAPAPAGAFTPSDSTAVAIAGNPLTVYVGPRGECQSSYVVNGRVEGNFFPGGEPYAFSQVADCGFFLGFPKGASQPPGVEKKTFGFQGNAGPSVQGEYTPVKQSEVSGAGTAASPYVQSTLFDVVDTTEHPEKTVAEVTETTTYVNGSPQFSSTYAVRNTWGKPLAFRAMYAGDLFVNGSDLGTGVFQGGPPRFIGGQNTNTGVFGGFIEAGLPSPAWSFYQELSFPSIWSAVESGAEEPGTGVFNDTIEPAEVDNAAGVEWDEYLHKPLAAGSEQAFTIINRTQVPSSLQISPDSQTLTQGQAETLTVTALDTAGQPYAGKTLRYAVEGANPQSGAVSLNGAGQAQISYIGNNAGSDTIQLYLDLPGSAKKEPNDPAAAATVTFLPRPVVPNSSYKVQSVHANPNGTVTIVFVPAQSGQATLEVTVPTGTIARRQAAEAARRKRCRKGLVRIRGRCRPPRTLSGRTSALGTAGTPLTLTVKPSKKVTAALEKRRTVKLTATLTYQSALGGSPTVQSFLFTLKPPRKHKKHNGH